MSDPSKATAPSARDELMTILGLIMYRGSVPHEKYDDAKFLLAELHECVAQSRKALKLLTDAFATSEREALIAALREIEAMANCTVVPGDRNESSQALAFDRGAQKAFEKAADIARAALAKAEERR